MWCSLAQAKLFDQIMFIVLQIQRMSHILWIVCSFIHTSCTATNLVYGMFVSSSSLLQRLVSWKNDFGIGWFYHRNCKIKAFNFSRVCVCVSMCVCDFSWRFLLTLVLGEYVAFICIYIFRPCWLLRF